MMLLRSLTVFALVFSACNGFAFERMVCTNAATGARISFIWKGEIGQYKMNHVLVRSLFDQGVSFIHDGLPGKVVNSQNDFLFSTLEPNDAKIDFMPHNHGMLLHYYSIPNKVTARFFFNSNECRK